MSRKPGSASPGGDLDTRIASTDRGRLRLGAEKRGKQRGTESEKRRAIETETGTGAERRTTDTETEEVTGTEEKTETGIEGGTRTEAEAGGTRRGKKGIERGKGAPKRGRNMLKERRGGIQTMINEGTNIRRKRKSERGMLRRKRLL